MFVNSQERSTIVTVYRRFMCGRMRFVLLVVALSFAAKVVSLISPKYYGGLVDYALAGRADALQGTILVILGLFASSSLISVFETYSHNYVLYRLDLDVKSSIFDTILQLSARQAEKRKVGELISRLEGDAGAVGRLFVGSLMSLILNLITVLVSGFFVMSISPTMTVIAIAAFLLSTGSFHLFGKAVEANHKRMRERMDAYFSRLQESISALGEIRILGAANTFGQIIGKDMRALFGLRMHAGNLGIGSGLASTTINTAAQIATVSVACWLIMRGAMTVGSYISFSMYLQFFSSALREISSMNLGVREALVSLNRLLELDELEIDNHGNSDRKYDPSATGVRLTGVSFSYDSSSPVLRDFNMSCPENAVTAVVGRSGSGKSTLLKVMVGLYPAAGSIAFGTKSWEKAASYSTLDHHITYIQQDPFIFNMSVADNLRLAKPDATDLEIRVACIRACADEFIRQLPEQYDTVIGERGTRLSGGERQRLAIARGLLRGSKILLLDEVTSSLDGEAEARLVEELRHLASDFTIIIISHRLSTIISVPNIVVLDKGQNVAEGTHLQLIQSCHTYRDMFLQQWQEYLRQGEAVGQG